MLLSRKNFWLATFLVIARIVCLNGQEANPRQTFCNPMNLDYRFMKDAVDAREAADPVVVLFKDEYYLFASRSGGFWVSSDLKDWTLVVATTKQLPLIEDYAPAVLVLGDSLYYTASTSARIYVTADPKSGVWTKRANLKSYGDPALYLDDDGRLYMYYGLSNVTPTYAVELDPDTFAEIGTRVEIVHANAAEHGWERRGDDNLLDEQPWIEGSWMVKHAGKYYLNYAGPGTEFKTYADGIYFSGAPLGPFTYAPYSPFSLKSTGFITGAGHGCTFQDKSGNWWRVVTMTISVKHMFERRLGLYPVGFDADSVIHTNTEFADYPQFLPGVKADQVSDNFAGWLLLSRQKYATASSGLPDHNVDKAVDEDARTYWAAATGDLGEWLLVDLGKPCLIHAIQVNFAEHGTTAKDVRGRDVTLYEQYTVEISSDSLAWTMLIDKSANAKDVPHDYIELAQSVEARYVKLTNVFTPGGGKFAVRDLRLFGYSDMANFSSVGDFTVEREVADERDAVIRWDPVAGADGYVVRYGIALDKLYNNYIVYDADSAAIHGLNKGVEYFFSVEAFDSGTDYYRGDYPDTRVGENPQGTRPERFVLEQNHPNPFNPETTIAYTLPRMADVRLDVFNLNGQKVFSHSVVAQTAGRQSFRFHADDLPSGVYVYRLKAGDFAQEKKMLLLK